MQVEVSNRCRLQSKNLSNPYAVQTKRHPGKMESSLSTYRLVLANKEVPKRLRKNAYNGKDAYVFIEIDFVLLLEVLKRFLMSDTWEY